MNKSESIQLLASALSKAQAEMPAIKFDSKNPFLKNDYASLGAIIAGARPVLAKHGLSVSQLTFGEDGVAGVETVLMHTSGEWISSSISMPVGEERGKSSAQVAGSIVTYLRRYSLASILGVYADEDGDGNKVEPERRPTRAAMPKEGPVDDPMTIERACKVTNSEGVSYDDIMTIERAMKVQNSEGVSYGDIPNDKLQMMILGINKGLKNGIDDEKRAEYLEKKRAIGVILKARANKEI